MHVEIAKARRSQSALLGSRSRCSLARSAADRLGVTEGMQVRIHNRETDRAGAYTVAAVRADDPPVWLSKRGREVLGSVDPFPASVVGTVPAPDVGYRDAWLTDEVVETLRTGPGRDDLLICAPHAGDVERNTDVAAVTAAKTVGVEACSLWMVHHFGEDAFDRWHVTTTRMHPASYPGLGKIADRGFDRAVSVHLWNGDEVLVGGLADPDLRGTLADALSEAVGGSWEVEHREGKYMAETEANLVNWLTADDRSGVQVELPAAVAQRYRVRVGKCIGAFFE